MFLILQYYQINFFDLMKHSSTKTAATERQITKVLSSDLIVSINEDKSDTNKKSIKKNQKGFVRYDENSNMEKEEECQQFTFTRSSKKEQRNSKKKNTYQFKKSTFDNFELLSSFKANSSSHEIEEQSLQLMQAKQKTYFSCLNSLKYFENGQRVDCIKAHQALAESRRPTDSCRQQTQKLISISSAKNLQKIVSSPQLPLNLIKPSNVSQKETESSQKKSNILTTKRTQVTNFAGMQLKKKQELILNIKLLQQNLAQALNLLQGEESTESLVKMGRLNRMETIINAKMQVDGKELLRLAKQSAKTS